MVDTGTLVGLGQGLTYLTYVLGTTVQALPIPRKEIRAWGIALQGDAVVAQFALASVSLVSLLVVWTSQVIQTSIGSPFDSEPVAMTTIMAQLVSLDTAFVLLVSALSVSVVLAPVANTLNAILGPAVTWTTIAIVVWSIIQVVLSLLTQVWLSAYTLGVVFLAIPFRLGRKFGTLLMASSIVLAIGLPLMPSIAIWLEGYVGYQTAVVPMMSMLSGVQSNPWLILSVIAILPQALGGLLAAVIISLIIFPFAYLFILSLLTRSLANLLGGAAGSPLLSDQVAVTSRDLESTLVRNAQ